MESQDCLVKNCRICKLEKSTCTECAADFKIVNNTCISGSNSTDSNNTIYLSVGISGLLVFLILFCVICICIFKRRASNWRAENEQSATIDTIVQNSSALSAVSNVNSPISSSILANLSNHLATDLSNQEELIIIPKESYLGSYRAHTELTVMDINIEISCDVCALCKINNQIQTIRYCLHAFHEDCLLAANNDSENLNCPLCCGSIDLKIEQDCIEISVINISEQSIVGNTEDNHRSVSESDENNEKAYKCSDN